MAFFKSILIAADFSENSRDAFRVACSLARSGETRLQILHVSEQAFVAEDPVYFGQQAVHFTPVPKDQTFYAEVNEKLRQFYIPDRPLEMEYHTRDGLPVDVILDTARENGCNLIVLGTHGRTGLSRLLAGSVAEGVLRGANCAVLALHSPDAGKSPSLGIRSILAPIDFSERSRSAAHVARALAAQIDARLVLVHVAPTEVVAGTEVMIPVDLQACRESLEALRKELDSPDLKSSVEVMLRQGIANEEILDVADSVKSGLIVMGTHGRTGLPRLLMGSVTEAVLRGSRCPVLAVKSVTIAAHSKAEAEQTQGLIASAHGICPPPSSVSPSDFKNEPGSRHHQDEAHHSTRAVTAEQQREASENQKAREAGSSGREHMVDIGRGNKQSGRQGS